tara:strand:- start:151 stop:495 length:345 start_codon:yes stop_codon:yes gene_type:complete
MYTCYKSKQSQLIIFFGIIAILISVFKYYNTKLVIVQAIIYYLLAYQSECLVYGSCNTSSWLIILLPCLAITIFILDFLEYFDVIKKKLQFLYSKLNLLNNSNLQTIIEKELTK